MRRYLLPGKRGHMSRAAVKLNILTAGVVALAVGLGVWAHVVNSPAHRVDITTNAQHQMVQLSYQGQTGQNALALLKKHATVLTKHYSFGDMVTTINGVKGTGPKYWTLYVNGKMATVGAQSYMAKNNDKIEWKLQ